MTKLGYSGRLLMSIRRRINSVGGRFAVAACNLGTGEQILIHPDEVFPSASVIKIPVLAALMAARDEGLLQLTNRATVRQSDIVGGSGVLLEMHTGLEVTLEDLANLMIVVSDNTATNMLIDRVGVDYIEAFLQSHHFERTKLQRRLFDMEARARGRDNLLTARDVSRLLEMIYRHKIPPLTPESCEHCMEIMGRQQCRDKIPLLLPKSAKVANKTGGLDDVSHDAAIVQPEGGSPYTLVVLSQGWPSVRKADLTIAAISRRVFDYFTTQADVK